MSEISPLSKPGPTSADGARVETPGGADIALPLDLRGGDRPTRGPRRLGLAVGVVLSALAAVAVVVSLPPRGESVPTTVPDASDTLGPSPSVTGLAMLRPRGGVTVVAPPSGSPDATVAALHVAIGERVRRGQPIATLGSHAGAAAACAHAAAELALREAELALARQRSDAERSDAEAALELATLEFERARRTSRRADELSARDSLARAERDDARTALAEARAELARAERRLARSAPDVETRPEVRVAAATVDVAEAALAATRSELDRSVVLAPLDATVIALPVRPGERPGADGIARLGETRRMEASIEVFQTRVGRVAVGDPVTLRSELFAAPLAAKVERVAPEVRRQGEISSDAAANTNARVVEVVAALDLDASASVGHLTHLQVLAEIDVGGTP